MYLKVLIFFLLLPLITVSSHGQTKPETGEPKNQTELITPDEIREAQELANLFTRRLQETRDLQPIIKEMYASGLVKGALKDKFLMGTMGLPIGFTDQLNEDDLLNYYTLRFSLDYSLTVMIQKRC